MTRLARTRVLFINEFYYPDVCASSAVLTDHLPKLAALRPDWQIVVLAGDRAWDRPDVRWPAHETHAGVDVHRVPRGAVRRTLVGRARGFWQFHRAAIRTGRTLPRVDVVVASTAPPLGGRIGRAVARRHGARLIYKVLDLYPECAAALGVISPRGLIDRAWSAADSAVMREADAVVTISERMRRHVLDTRGIPADNVRHIADGFDPDRLAFDGANRFRTEHGLQDKFVVQYAGNMGLSHPFETILGAVRALASDAGIAFQFIGAGPGRERLAAALAAERLPVQLLDYQPAERLGEVLAAADVALITQDARMADLALPYKVYGLLAAATPAIFVGDEKSEIVEWYQRAECGLHVRQGDVDGLVAAIRGLKSDASRTTTMGGRARQLLNERFHSSRAVEAWAELVEEVLARRDRTAGTAVARRGNPAE